MDYGDPVGPKIGAAWTLNDADQRDVRAITAERTRRNVQAGARELKKTEAPAEAIALDGCAAEWCFGRMAGLDPDRTTDPRSKANGTDRGDYVLPDGSTLDVKATFRSNGQLIAPVRYDNPRTAEIAALMVGTFPRFEFRGAAFFAVLCRPANVRELGARRIRTYCLPQSALWDLESLLWGGVPAAGGVLWVD